MSEIEAIVRRCVLELYGHEKDPMGQAMADVIYLLNQVKGLRAELREAEAILHPQFGR